MMTSKITKKDITNLAFNQGSLGMEFSWNYERQMHIAFAMMMNHNLKKIYEGDEEGYRDALVRHVEFFNITPQLAPFVGGVVTSMEEMKARGEVDGEAIASIKTALMGPLSGIGDSIFVGCLRVIAVGIGISLAQAGNIMGPILYFLLYNIPCFIVRYFGAHFGYNLGFNYLQKMQENGMMDKLLSAASILGVMVVGCMSKDMVWTTLNVELSRIGDEVTTLQSILDGIMPGLIGLGGTWLYYFLLKKKVNPVILIFGGSQGAQRINENVTDLIINEYNKNYQIIWATGPKQFDIVKEKLKEHDLDIENIKNAKILPYIYNMEELINICDLVVCRSGAMTITEIAIVEKPAIFIPLPSVGANRQEDNARVMEKLGSAKVILNSEINKDNLNSYINDMIKDRNKLNQMGKLAGKIATKDVEEKIYDEIK